MLYNLGRIQEWGKCLHWNMWGSGILYKWECYTGKRDRTDEHSISPRTEFFHCYFFDRPVVRKVSPLPRLSMTFTKPTALMLFINVHEIFHSGWRKMLLTSDALFVPCLHPITISCTIEVQTRKHSSRMRTAHLLTISRGIPGPVSAGGMVVGGWGWEER